MPVFTLSFCVIIVLIYILDNFILIPKTATVTLKEKLWAGHNKGYINHALRLSEQKIKKGQVWRLMSSSLLHIGTWHIISNVTATLIVGYAVESQLGTAKTALCFVVSVLVSGLYMAFVYKLQEGEGGIDFPGFFHYWYYAKRKGYAGTWCMPAEYTGLTHEQEAAYAKRDLKWLKTLVEG